MNYKTIILFTNPIPNSWNLELVLLTAISVLLSVTLILFLAIMIARSIKIKRNNRTERLRNLFYTLFTEASFAETESIGSVILKAKELNKKFLSKKKYARIITKDLLSLYNSLSGSSKSNLKFLYIEAGFVKHSEDKMHSPSWQIKAQGIRELAQMKHGPVLSKLKEIAKDKHDIVKENAQISLVKMEGFNGLYFLNDKPTPISDWQQLNLIEALKEYRNSELPDFTVWLSSSEDTVILFGIRLMRYFKQIKGSEKLIPLINHSNKKIKIETIQTISALNVTDALPTLIEQYSNESTEVKTEIIKTFGNLTQINNTDILIQWITESNDHKIHKACLDAMVGLNIIHKLKGLKLEQESLQFQIDKLLHTKTNKSII